MRLWVRLTLWMAALAVIPTLITGALALRAADEVAKLRPEEELVRQASMLSTVVGGWLDGQKGALEGWNRAFGPDVIEAEFQVHFLRGVYTAVDPVVSVALIDEEGVPLVPVEYRGEGLQAPGRVPGSPARAAALVAKAPVDVPVDGTVTSQPYVPPGTQTPVVALATRRGDSPVRLVAEISLAALEDIFKSSDTLAYVLLSGDLQPLVGGNHPLVDTSVRDAVSTFEDNFTFMVEASEARPALRGAAWRVPGATWWVLALEPSEVSEKALRTIQTQTALVGLIVLIVVTALGSLLERMITLPLAKLRDFATRIAEGEYAQRETVERVRRDDELGELEEAFRDMAHRLEANQARIVAQRDEILSQKDEIDRFNEELQERVDERTRELQDAQHQLVEASQTAAVAEVGAGLAHELNNPLAAILGVAQLMLSAEQGDRRLLQQIEQEAQRCREVVETMVRFSAGEVDPRRARVVDLGGAVREIVASMHTSYQQRGVALSYEVPPEAVFARLDPNLGEQLIGRFFEAMRAGLGDGAKLSVQVARTDKGAELWFVPDRVVASGGAADDWRASGVQFWVARRLVELSGGHIVPAKGDQLAWRVVLPGA